MKKTILEIYAMAVCFVGVLFFCGFFCSDVYHTVKYFAPITLMDEYNQYQNNDSFCQRTFNGCFNSNDEKTKVRLSDEAVAKKREQALANAIEETKHASVLSIILASIFMPIAAIAFLIHWKIGRKAREANA